MRSNDGFTLIEVLVSLVLLSIIVLGFFNFSLSINKQNELINQKRLAFELCQKILKTVDQGQLSLNFKTVTYNKSNLDQLPLRDIKKYNFVKSIRLNLKDLVIDENKLDGLYILSIVVNWSDHKFDFYTVVKGDE
ncbi:MAG: type II secretion system protein [Halanaerobiales bacterium]|nr:type II secretion system protein [Halanaerobiales bacterium]